MVPEILPIIVQVHQNTDLEKLVGAEIDATIQRLCLEAEQRIEMALKTPTSRDSLRDNPNGAITVVRQGINLQRLIIKSAMAAIPQLTMLMAALDLESRGNEEGTSIFLVSIIAISIGVLLSEIFPTKFKYHSPLPQPLGTILALNQFKTTEGEGIIRQAARLLNLEKEFDQIGDKIKEQGITELAQRLQTRTRHYQEIIELGQRLAEQPTENDVARFLQLAQTYYRNHSAIR